MTTESATSPSAAAQAVATVTPYLNFDGRCEEALDFYEKTLGATIDCKMRFSENPDPMDDACCSGADADAMASKIMHAQFTVGSSVIFASDCDCSGKTKMSGVSLALQVATAAEVDALFAALGDGGAAQMPLDSPFFAERFGVVEDRFGVSWMLLAGPKG